jgi:L-threonylcarbamoyladenylate synthase
MTKIFDFKTEINKDELEEAAQSLKKGKLVIFPTETVYGIGANALDSKAVDDIFVAKGRANDNPLIVHISDFSMLEELVEEPSELEKKLMDAFMPGPFTPILKKKDINVLITSGTITSAKMIEKNRKFFIFSIDRIKKNMVQY